MEEKDLKTKFLQKKASVRKKLVEGGVQIKEGVNSLDGYTYFSEAQYKKLFSGFFAEEGLDLSCSTLSVTETKGPNYASFGRRVEVVFTLTDVETGYSEQVTAFGEAFDKGDKALYKAYTGAIKYYLANNWMVVTGDDPENERAVVTATIPTVENDEPKATAKQIEVIKNLYTDAEIIGMMQRKGYDSITDFTLKEASQMLNFKKRAEVKTA